MPHRIVPWLEGFTTTLSLQARHENALLSMAGVAGIGISRSGATGTPVIEIYVESRGAASAAALPQALEGVPVTIVETGRFTPFGGR